MELEPDNQKGLFTLTERQIRETAEIMGGFSLYAAQEELRQGFLPSVADTGSVWQEERC